MKWVPDVMGRQETRRFLKPRPIPPRPQTRPASPSQHGRRRRQRYPVGRSREAGAPRRPCRFSQTHGYRVPPDPTSKALRAAKRKDSRSSRLNPQREPSPVASLRHQTEPVASLRRRPGQPEHAPGSRRNSRPDRPEYATTPPAGPAIAATYSAGANPTRARCNATLPVRRARRTNFLRGPVWVERSFPATSNSHGNTGRVGVLDARRRRDKGVYQLIGVEGVRCQMSPFARRGRGRRFLGAISLVVWRCP
jgi:hypothetical protein